MKFVLIEDAATTTYALLTGDGAVPLTGALDGLFDSRQAELQHLIEAFDVLRPRLEERAASSPAIPLTQMRLLPPVPRPGKILITTATYGAPPTDSPPQAPGHPEERGSVVGPGDTIQLPDVDASTWARTASITRLSDATVRTTHICSAELDRHAAWLARPKPALTLPELDARRPQHSRLPGQPSMLLQGLRRAFDSPGTRYYTGAIGSGSGSFRLPMQPAEDAGLK
jgi:hypothetical protein